MIKGLDLDLYSARPHGLAGPVWSVIVQDISLVSNSAQRSGRTGSRAARDAGGQCVGDGFLVFVINEVRDGKHDVAEEADVFRLEAAGTF